MIKVLSMQSRTPADELRTEVIRKSIHMMIAIVPTLARFNVTITMMILSMGLMLYTYAEMLRIQGISLGFISRITESAARVRDRNSFVYGPVTLGLGAMLALMLYPEPAAAVAIYALAFGDGFSSLFGKVFGRVRIPLTGGKTFAGSLACLISVFIAGYSVTGNLRAAVIISAAATFLEALPSRDLDNLILPVGTGLITVFVMGL